MTAVQDLVDRLALRDLAEAYARCADRCDGRGLAELFVPDGELHVRSPGDTAPGRSWRGRSDIADAIVRLARFDATFHFVGNHSAAIAGDEATAEVYCLAHHVAPPAPGGPSVDHVMVIRYHDRCRREADGWRFVERELHVDWTEDRPVVSPPAPRVRPEG